MAVVAAVAKRAQSSQPPFAASTVTHVAVKANAAVIARPWLERRVSACALASPSRPVSCVWLAVLVTK